MNYHSIAIDGPSGAGKSTLARMLAQELGYLYVDTGAIYRTVGLCAFRKGVEPTDARAVTALLDGMEIDLRYEQDGVQHMYLDGEDVTREIRRHEISRYASDVSAIPAVRAFLLERQRELARRGDVIMDGRDIGTVVRVIRKRVEYDTRRAAAPLRQAEDALLVDTTGNTLEESFQVLLQTIKERLQA